MRASPRPKQQLQQQHQQQRRAARQPDPALTARVTALEAALRQGVDAASASARDAKSRADAAFELAQKAPAQAPTVAPAELQALAARVTALEQAAKALEGRVAVTAGADRAGRLAFVAVALRGAVERGEPFVQELAAAKPLVPDAAALAPLEPFAATGVPRTAALARELSQLAAPVLNAAGSAPRGEGFLDRVQQNAERLVRIRPISETPGDDAATIVARAEAKAVAWRSWRRGVRACDSPARRTRTRRSMDQTRAGADRGARGGAKTRRRCGRHTRQGGAMSGMRA